MIPGIVDSLRYANRDVIENLPLRDIAHSFNVPYHQQLPTQPNAKAFTNGLPTGPSLPFLLRDALALTPLHYPQIPIPDAMVSESRRQLPKSMFIVPDAVDINSMFQALIRQSQSNSAVPQVQDATFQPSPIIDTALEQTALSAVSYMLNQPLSIDPTLPTRVLPPETAHHSGTQYESQRAASEPRIFPLQWSSAAPVDLIKVIAKILPASFFMRHHTSLCELVQSPAQSIPDLVIRSRSRALKPTILPTLMSTMPNRMLFAKAWCQYNLLVASFQPRPEIQPPVSLSAIFPSISRLGDRTRVNSHIHYSNSQGIPVRRVDENISPVHQHNTGLYQSLTIIPAAIVTTMFPDHYYDQNIAVSEPPMPVSRPSTSAKSRADVTRQNSLKNSIRYDDHDFIRIYAISLVLPHVLRVHDRMMRLFRLQLQVFMDTVQNSGLSPQMMSIITSLLRDRFIANVNQQITMLFTMLFLPLQQHTFERCIAQYELHFQYYFKQSLMLLNEPQSLKHPWNQLDTVVQTRHQQASYVVSMLHTNYSAYYAMFCRQDMSSLETPFPQVIVNCISYQPPHGSLSQAIQAEAQIQWLQAQHKASELLPTLGVSRAMSTDLAAIRHPESTAQIMLIQRALNYHEDTMRSSYTDEIEVSGWAGKHGVRSFHSKQTESHDVPLAHPIIQLDGPLRTLSFLHIQKFHEYLDVRDRLFSGTMQVYCDILVRMYHMPPTALLSRMKYLKDTGSRLTAAGGAETARTEMQLMPIVRQMQENSATFDISHAAQVMAQTVAVQHTKLPVFSLFRVLPVYPTDPEIRTQADIKNYERSVRSSAEYVYSSGFANLSKFAQTALRRAMGKFRFATTDVAHLSTSVPSTTLTFVASMKAMIDSYQSEMASNHSRANVTGPSAGDHGHGIQSSNIKEFTDTLAMYSPEEKAEDQFDTSETATQLRGNYIFQPWEPYSVSMHGRYLLEQLHRYYPSASHSILQSTDPNTPMPAYLMLPARMDESLIQLDGSTIQRERMFSAEYHQLTSPDCTFLAPPAATQFLELCNNLAFQRGGQYCEPGTDGISRPFSSQFSVMHRSKLVNDVRLHTLLQNSIRFPAIPYLYESRHQLVYRCMAEFYTQSLNAKVPLAPGRNLFKENSNSNMGKSSAPPALQQTSSGVLIPPNLDQSTSKSKSHQASQPQQDTQIFIRPSTTIPPLREAADVGTQQRSRNRFGVNALPTPQSTQASGQSLSGELMLPPAETSLSASNSTEPLSPREIAPYRADLSWIRKRIDQNPLNPVSNPVSIVDRLESKSLHSRLSQLPVSTSQPASQASKYGISPISESPQQLPFITTAPFTMSDILIAVRAIIDIYVRTTMFQGATDTPITQQLSRGAGRRNDTTTGQGSPVGSVETRNDASLTPAEFLRLFELTVELPRLPSSPTVYKVLCSATEKEIDQPNPHQFSTSITFFQTPSEVAKHSPLTDVPPASVLRRFCGVMASMVAILLSPKLDMSRLRRLVSQWFRFGLEEYEENPETDSDRCVASALVHPTVAARFETPGSADFIDMTQYKANQSSLSPQLCDIAETINVIPGTWRFEFFSIESLMFASQSLLFTGETTLNARDNVATSFKLVFDYIQTYLIVPSLRHQFTLRRGLSTEVNSFLKRLGEFVLVQSTIKSWLAHLTTLIQSHGGELNTYGATLELLMPPYTLPNSDANELEIRKASILSRFDEYTTVPIHSHTNFIDWYWFQFDPVRQANTLPSAALPVSSCPKQVNVAVQFLALATGKASTHLSASSNSDVLLTTLIHFHCMLHDYLTSSDFNSLFDNLSQVQRILSRIVELDTSARPVLPSENSQMRDAIDESQLILSITDHLSSLSTTLLTYRQVLTGVSAHLNQAFKYGPVLHGSQVNHVPVSDKWLHICTNLFSMLTTFSVASFTLNARPIDHTVQFASLPAFNEVVGSQLESILANTQGHYTIPGTTGSTTGQSGFMGQVHLLTDAIELYSHHIVTSCSNISHDLSYFDGGHTPDVYNFALMYLYQLLVACQSTDLTAPIPNMSFVTFVRQLTRLWSQQ